jgi:hypothetical protein
MDIVDRARRSSFSARSLFLSRLRAGWTEARGAATGASGGGARLLREIGGAGTQNIEMKILE